MIKNFIESNIFKIGIIIGIIFIMLGIVIQECLK